MLVWNLKFIVRSTPKPHDFCTFRHNSPHCSAAQGVELHTVVASCSFAPCRVGKGTLTGSLTCTDCWASSALVSCSSGPASSLLDQLLMRQSTTIVLHYFMCKRPYNTIVLLNFEQNSSLENIAFTVVIKQQIFFRASNFGSRQEGKKLQLYKFCIINFSFTANQAAIRHFPRRTVNNDRVFTVDLVKCQIAA